METRNITIVGGGSAGWMTATTLLNQFPDKKITLVESPNTPNIGVGESTVAGGQSGFSGIINWLKMVDIKDYDFMPHCDAIYKLSIAFKDWYRKDSGTFHFPFGESRFQYMDSGDQSMNIHPNNWHLKKIFYPETPVSDYAECFFPTMALVNQNKSLFADNFNVFTDWSDLEKDELNNEVRLSSGYSYQFDATKFSIWLKDNYCKARYSNNFTHILAEVKGIPLNDNGIKHLILDTGQKLEADLFIDCTGFKSLLLTKTFNVPFISIENFIPNNYAWATKIPYTDPETQIVNYTNCTAIENGWIWEIPLWSRMGSGYVFSDKFISSEEALKEFKRGLIKKGYENVENLEYHLIPMKCGIQSKLWVKNTCAIGLAAGFIEPLQSNGLHSIHQFIFNLCRILKRGYISQWDRNEFTAKCQDDFHEFASVVALSYLLTHRDDSEYWREIQNRNWSDEHHKLFSSNDSGIWKKLHGLYHFKNHDISFPPGDNILNCMTTGMNWNSIDEHSLKYMPNFYHMNTENIKSSTKDIAAQMEKRKKRWNKQVKNFPSPYQYLKNNIHNIGV
jgi:tryptophan halogenase